MTIHNDNLYYGGRNHYVKQMNQHHEISLFKPPHYDMITSLTTLDNYLISGSRDKFLKLWSINNY